MNSGSGVTDMLVLPNKQWTCVVCQELLQQDRFWLLDPRNGALLCGIVCLGRYGQLIAETQNATKH